MVTYKQLKSGYILQPDDMLNLHGIVYKVSPCYYLQNTVSGDNARVFKKLDRHTDRDEWAKIFGLGDEGGDFPEMKSMEALTKFVIDIYEYAEVHPGDKVRIKFREGNQDDYPYDFVDEMTDYSGKVFTVRQAVTDTPSKDWKYENGDPHCYRLEGNNYMWHSSMFEKVNPGDELESEKQEQEKKGVTYGDLIDGYILQEYDAVNIAGIPYRVCRGINGNFLYVEGDVYDKIFTLLGIKKKDDFCKRFGELASTGCCFPEFKTMEGLTKCVIELMERAEHIPVSPEPRPSSTTDTGTVRLPEIKENPMGEITYTDLKKGRVLSLGDKLSICGIGYTVGINSRENRYYLMGLKYCHNDAIFSKIGRLDDKFEWARRFDASVKDDGVFPELESLEKLTKFVIDIFEEARRKEASLATDRDFGPKVGAIPKGTPVVNVLSDEPKELISILPKKIKTYIIL